MWGDSGVCEGAGLEQWWFVHTVRKLPDAGFLALFLGWAGHMPSRVVQACVICLCVGWGLSGLSHYCPKGIWGPACVARSCDTYQLNLVPRAMWLRYSSYPAEIDSTRSPNVHVISSITVSWFLVYFFFSCGLIWYCCGSPNDITFSIRHKMWSFVTSTQLSRDASKKSVSAMFWLPKNDKKAIA